MRKLAALIVSLLVMGSAAHAETFKLNIQTMVSYACADQKWHGCTNEFVNLGIVEIELIDGQGEWNQQITQNKVNFAFSVFIAKGANGYGIYPSTSATSIVSGQKSVAANLYVLAKTPEDLNTVGIFTDSLEVNGTGNGSLMEIRSYTHVP